MGALGATTASRHQFCCTVRLGHGRSRTEAPRSARAPVSRTAPYLEYTRSVLETGARANLGASVLNLPGPSLTVYTQIIQKPESGMSQELFSPETDRVKKSGWFLSENSTTNVRHSDIRTRNWRASAVSDHHRRASVGPVQSPASSSRFPDLEPRVPAPTHRKLFATMY